MIKKLILGFVLVVFFTCIGLYARASMMPKTPSEYKIGVSYDVAMKSEKPMLALFYVDWCTYCLRFMPKYRVVASLYKDSYNVVMLNAEDPKLEKLVKDVSLSGFPTLYIIDPKYDNRILLNNAIYTDLRKLRVELDRYLRIRTLLDK